MRSHLLARAASICVLAVLSCGAHAAPFKTLYTFSGAADGGAPTGNLVAGPNGSFYGVAAIGGASNSGTVFQLTRPKAGAPWTVTTLYSFAGGADAAAPSNLTADAFGNLYGTSTAGGGSAVCTDANGNPIGCGTIFQLSPKQGGGWTEQVLYAFQGVTDGQAPRGVAFDRAGNLYGFGFIGGTGTCSFETFAFACGTVFKLSPVENAPWAFTVIYNFKNNADGDGLFGPPLIDPQGNIYGETEAGGPAGAPADCAPSTGCGEVFKLSQRKDGTWSKQVIWTFSGPDGDEGSNALTQDWAGNIYGLTNEGGPPNPLCPANSASGASPGCGVAFQLSPPANGSNTWTYHKIWDFTLGADSGYPFNTTITLLNNRLFTTSSGPYPLAPSYGAVVEFIPNAQENAWREKTLFTFTNDALNEAQPESTLFLSGKQLFGTTAGYSTPGSFGTVFSVRP